jgi:hypothetical protein
VKALGLDLGTVNPAGVVLDLSKLRPRVTWRAHGHFPKPESERVSRATSLRLRQRKATQLLTSWIDAAAADGVRHVIVENPETTAFGKRQRGRETYMVGAMLAAQCNEVTGHARARGMEVIHVTPQECMRAMGLKLPVCPSRDPKVKRAHEHVRRKAKKEQTARFARLCIDGAELLETEDEVDAASVAWVGGRKVR